MDVNPTGALLFYFFICNRNDPAYTISNKANENALKEIIHHGAPPLYKLGGHPKKLSITLQAPQCQKLERADLYRQKSIRKDAAKAL